MSYLTRQAIDLNKFMLPDETCEVGASVVLIGAVRKHSLGKEVEHLEYEAFEEIAEAQIDDLVDAIFRKWPILSARLQHRLGDVRLGEAAVVIEITAVHRDEAYRASRFLIEEIKHCVPIWKKEYFKDGTSEWGKCQHDALIQ